MRFVKITEGHVIQTFNYAGEFVSQEFVAGDDVEFGIEGGNLIYRQDMPLGGEEYYPFTMQNPVSKVDLDFTFDELQKCLATMTDDEKANDVTVCVDGQFYKVDGFVYGTWDDKTKELADGILDNDHPFLIV